ncbi:hypothetical protein [Tenacibaculum sp. 47A_GOM-205m]|uniref:hypothetical protein n=1 Tax=Tenacibaculum sp. 47A_GOM-205m TaxID=1380384 RepID=UPI00048A880B|nr:hypothetical protein [Tenacibaculum sp. 47A_GOM-205m]
MNLKYKLELKESIKNQVIQTVLAIENPMSGTPMEGLMYLKILGDVIERFKVKLIKKEHTLSVLGNEYEVEKVLNEIHFDIRERLLD